MNEYKNQTVFTSNELWTLTQSKRYSYSYWKRWLQHQDVFASEFIDCSSCKLFAFIALKTVRLITGQKKVEKNIASLCRFLAGSYYLLDNTIAVLFVLPVHKISMFFYIIRYDLHLIVNILPV